MILNIEIAGENRKVDAEYCTDDQKDGKALEEDAGGGISVALFIAL